MAAMKHQNRVTYILILVLSFILIFFVFMSESESVPHQDSHPVNFQFAQHKVNGANKFRLLRDDGSEVSYSDAIILMESPDPKFRQMISEVLRKQQRTMPAYFWECPPFSAHTLSSIPFEFVVLPADVLLSRRPDRNSFEEKFSDGSAAVAFPSLGGDAMLIAPVPQEGVADEVYMHLAAFVTSAGDDQVDALWRTVAQTIRKQLAAVSTTKRIWLSTSGAGVQWLHVRLDSRPKYYNWQEYKQ